MILGYNVTKFAPHEAQKETAPGKLNFDDTAVLHWVVLRSHVDVYSYKNGIHAPPPRTVLGSAGTPQSYETAPPLEPP